MLSYLKHLNNFFRVNCQRVTRIDSDHGGSSIGVDEIVAISLSKCVKNRTFIEVSGKEAC